MRKKLDEYVEFYNKLYQKRYRKKYSNKPVSIQVQAQRALSSALAILANLKDVPYDELINSIYIYCKDSTLQWLTREYEKQIELAGANPERFVFQIHSFFNDISAKVRKRNLYSEIVDYLGAYMELAYTCPPEVNRNIANAYMELLVQTPDYLRPDKYNFKQCVIGVTTGGQLLCVPQVFPFYDLPWHEIQVALESGKLTPEKIHEALPKVYAKHGIPIRTWDELLVYSMLERIHSSTITALMPYVNEYTCDVVPQDYYKSHKTSCGSVSAPVSHDDLLKYLKARKRTLPANGTRIVFDDPSGEMVELLLKEAVKNNAVVMLYRLTTSNGDLSGYFNTQNSFFYSINLETNNPDLYYQSIKHLILYCYTACVTNQIPPDGYAVHNKGKPVPFKVYGIGGRLKAVYNPDGAGVSRIGNPDFETKTVPVSENIRKLPIGQKASEQAVLLARQWGFDLDPGETFVRSFCKEVFVRRQT